MNNSKQSTVGRPGLDWSQIYWPGPARVFSEAEMLRGGQQPWPRGMNVYLAIAGVLSMTPIVQFAPREARVWVSVALLLVVALALYIARLLWTRPSRSRLNWMAYAVSIPPAAALIGTELVRKTPKDQIEAQVAFPLLVGLGVFTVAYLGWWAIVMLRSQQIESRLAELDEQDRTLRLAIKLATAQIQPHFLFNTLASLQHWVDTQDARAAPTLRAFTQYLRSTLPMFERETLSLAEELQIVRNYLLVMQARLGERLNWNIDATKDLGDLALPPGTLLTLVENAIAHGIEPALRGGRIDVRAVRENGQFILEVSDDGAGLCGDAPEGVGLSNTRARLQHQFGDKARLNLKTLNPGCLARIEILNKP